MRSRQPHAAPRQGSDTASPLTIVMPAYNEAQRLPTTLTRIARFRQRSGIPLDVLVVDDGSTDATVADVRARAHRHTLPMPVHVIALGRHAGPGVAARVGMLAATGQRLLLCDADGCVPFDEVERLSAQLDRGYHIAVGSRAMDPRSIRVAQPLHRIAMGRVWGRTVRALVPTPVRDTQCGFKLFDGDAARTLFRRLRSASFAFHIELIALSQALGLRLVEMPVTWSHRDGSSVDLVREPLRMLRELLAVRNSQRTHRWSDGGDHDEHDV